MSLDPEFLAHFPKEVSQELVDYVRDIVFYESRYVFVKTVKGIQRGYCSHCEKDYMIDQLQPLKHNETWTCQHCASPVVVKSAGRGRKNLFTDAYVVWYEKSQVDSQAIVAMGLHVCRDYEDYRNVKTMFRKVSMYLFEPGYSEQRVYIGWRDVWSKLKKIRSESTGLMQYKGTFISHENVATTVQNTPFQYSTWESYKNLYGREDLVHFFALAARYSCIEYLTKIGFRKFIEAKLTGLRTYGTINWNGKTLEKVIRLSKSELKQLKRERVIPRPELLYVYQTLKKHGLSVSFETADLLDDLFIEEAIKLHEPLDFVTKYALKQRSKSLLAYHSTSSIIRDLRDYWQEAEELGLDVTKDHIKYPNNLQKAHEDTSRRIKIKVDEKVNEQIKKRLPSLERHSFTQGRLHIRPAASSIELFDEGKALKHCVGQYAKRYAEGDTDIYVIRKNDAPNKSYFTVEIQQNRVIQCRGFRNCNMTKEVAAFIEAFVLEKLKRRKRNRNLSA
ncbi:hypothetical protein GCM10008934_25030 [Virgibacillus salarius]|uniref:PcfJ domain-containing protein n=1 Tax=Virgibacillus salarius TaxID=447199 RepID=UPI0031DAE218